jgi:O-antigen/teichoic acid export membrane protein
MSLNKKIAFNSASQIIGKTISTILGLVSVIIMLRTLGIERYGWYSTASYFLMFIGIMGDFGFAVMTNRFLSDPHLEKTKVFNTLITLRFISALVFQIAAPLLVLLFPYRPEVKLATVILTFSFFASALNQVFTGSFQSQLKNYLPITAEVLSRIALVVGTYYVAKEQHAFIWLMIVITLASFVYTALLWYKHPPFSFKIDSRIARLVMKGMWPVALSVIFNAVYLQGDKVLLPLYVNDTDVGLYGSAYRIIDISTQIAALLMGIMLPLLTVSWNKNLKQEFKSFYQLSLNLLALFLFPTLVGLFVLAKPLMNFIAPNFILASELLRWLSFILFGVWLGMTYGHIMLAINKQKQSIFAFASTALLALAGYLILIPHYGVWAAAGVSIASECLAGLMLLGFVTYYTRTLPPLWSLTKITLASVTMGYALYYFQTLPLVLLVFLGIILYALLIICLRVISLTRIKETFFSKKQLA